MQEIEEYDIRVWFSKTDLAQAEDIEEYDIRVWFIKTDLAQAEDIEEYDIRVWFIKTDLAQAEDTYRVITGILEARREAQPTRKRRKDAGKSKQGRMELREPGK
jgi:hypothetical protein